MTELRRYAQERTTVARDPGGAAVTRGTGVVTMLRAAKLNVHLYIDEDADGTTYVQALMVRHDRQLLAQSKIVLPPQDQRAEPRDDWQIAADALPDLAQKLMQLPRPAAAQA
jgi:hypothetical protein